MSGFRFRLQPLLDRKIELKEEAEKALIDRRKELAAENERLEQARQHERDLIEKKQKLRREIMSSQAANTGEQIRRRVEYIGFVGLEIDKAKEAIYAQQLVVSEAEAKVKAAVEHLAECTRDVDVLKKYREKLETRFLRDAERKEALELDEIGNMLYTTRRQS